MAEQWTDKLRNPSVRGSGRQGNWPDTLPSAIHSTFLPQPCPNPTTPPPLPSASPPRPLPLLAPSSEIFHPNHPAPFQILEYQTDVRRCRFDFPKAWFNACGNHNAPPHPLQSGPGARVTNARRGPPLFCRFSFFHCFTECPVSSAVHVRFPRATGGRGSLGQWHWGESLGIV